MRFFSVLIDFPKNLHFLHCFCYCDYQTEEVAGSKMVMEGGCYYSKIIVIFNLEKVAKGGQFNYLNLATKEEGVILNFNFNFNWWYCY